MTTVTPRGGRPLAPDRTPAILSVTASLLRDVGFDHLRIQDVADAAGVGLATIYRRWPTKQALVIDALGHSECFAAVTTTGDARTDLRELLRRHAADLTGPQGQLLPGLLCSLRSEPEVAAVVRKQIVDRMHARIRELVASVLGEDDPDLDARAELGPALLYYRALVRQDIDDPVAVADEITELVLRPR